MISDTILEAGTRTYYTKVFKIPKGSNTIYGELTIPSGIGPFPTIILSHGFNGSNSDWEEDCNYYASHGFVTYRFDFCGGSNRSKSTGSTTQMSVLTEKEELIAVFHAIAALPEVDNKRIFMIGGSQGGLITAFALEKLKNNVHAAILYFPALCIADDWRGKFPAGSDIPDEIDFWGVQLGRCYAEDVMNLDIMSSIGHYDGDVLILHGEKDPIVPLSYSQKAQKRFPFAELITYPDEMHGFTPETNAIARSSVLAFMQAHLFK